MVRLLNVGQHSQYIRWVANDSRRGFVFTINLPSGQNSHLGNLTHITESVFNVRYRDELKHYLFTGISHPPFFTKFLRCKSVLLTWRCAYLHAGNLYPSLIWYNQDVKGESVLCCAIYHKMNKKTPASIDMKIVIWSLLSFIDGFLNIPHLAPELWLKGLSLCSGLLKCLWASFLQRWNWFDDPLQGQRHLFTFRSSWKTGCFPTPSGANLGTVTQLLAKFKKSIPSWELSILLKI